MNIEEEEEYNYQEIGERGYKPMEIYDNIIRGYIKPIRIEKMTIFYDECTIRGLEVVYNKESGSGAHIAEGYHSKVEYKTLELENDEHLHIIKGSLVKGSSWIRSLQLYTNKGERVNVHCKKYGEVEQFRLGGADATQIVKLIFGLDNLGLAFIGVYVAPIIPTTFFTIHTILHTHTTEIQTATYTHTDTDNIQLLKPNIEDGLRFNSSDHYSNQNNNHKENTEILKELERNIDNSGEENKSNLNKIEELMIMNQELLERVGKLEALNIQQHKIIRGSL